MGITLHETIPAQFLAAIEAYDKPDAFRHKRDGAWADISHRDVYGRVCSVVSALQARKVARGDRVAILSENRIEWAVTDLAILSIGAVTVPIYPTLIATQIEYILRDAEVRVAFVSSRDQARKLQGLRARLPHLEQVIAFDDDAGGDGASTLATMLRDAPPALDDAAYRALVAQVHPRDWASIIYTSGTTGEPKGAVLSHKNFMTNVRQCLAVFDLGPADVSLSFLPLSHVFERGPGFYVMMTAGVTIAYAESIERVPDNLREVHPTVVCSVPRVYEKMYARTLDTVAKGAMWRRRLFAWGVGVGRAAVARAEDGGEPGGLALAIARALVFKKLRERVGGRLRFFISGGAPLAREIAEFFWAAGIPILEGYGLTEMSPVISVNTFANHRFGSVGQPLPDMDVRIADDGEILARGDNVMQGYFRKPEQTDEALAGGWFHTGDIGKIDENGFLFITDRKKDLIATAGGKKIAPQPIESHLKHSKYISEAVLIGDRRPFISLLIVPNFERLERWARDASIDVADHERLVESPAVRELYQRIIDDENRELAQFERIKNFVILAKELTVEDGHLTPTLKVRRRIVEATYQDRIDAMYQPAPGGNGG
ncbi:MAG TPA: long-chain fatty acid--CoA ligase [Candidatus Krumholzibacteria bacterium]|nr:long-chain fatty acid--CoA ligase [Candidatus Krumholzibacteria bacterium]